MKYMKISVLYISFLSVFNIGTIKPILPETIATTTLLKYGGAAIAAVLGSRYVGQGSKEFQQRFKMRLPVYSSSEFYDVTESSGDEFQRSFKQNLILKSEIRPTLFSHIKEVIAVENRYEKLKKYKQKLSGKFKSDTASDVNNGTTNSWNQTYVHAQQARGLFLV